MKSQSHVKSQSYYQELGHPYYNMFYININKQYYVFNVFPWKVATTWRKLFKILLVGLILKKLLERDLLNPPLMILPAMFK